MKNDKHETCVVQCTLIEMNENSISQLTLKSSYTKQSTFMQSCAYGIWMECDLIQKPKIGNTKW